MMRGSAWLLVLAGCTSSVTSSPPTCDELAATLPSEGWAHVSDGTAVTYGHNPPAPGAHDAQWLAWKQYDRPAKREHWVHNLEHGGIVLLYRPDAAAAVVDALKKRLCRCAGRSAVRARAYTPDAGSPARRERGRGRRAARDGRGEL